MNPAIARLLIGKNEAEATQILQQFGKIWRIFSRDNKPIEGLGTERNDQRYNLVISNGVVERVIFG